MIEILPESVIHLVTIGFPRRGSITSPRFVNFIGVMFHFGSELKAIFQIALSH